jgi:hypothetical protein
MSRHCTAHPSPRAGDSEVLEQQTSLGSKQEPVEERLIARKGCWTLVHSEPKTWKVEALARGACHEHGAVWTRSGFKGGTMGHHRTRGIVGRDLPQMPADDQSSVVSEIRRVQGRSDLPKLTPGDPTAYP